MSQNKTDRGTDRWEINGLSLSLDLEDAAAMERYEQAFDKLSDAEKLLPKDGRHSAVIRAYCKLYRDLYDCIFGEGTAEQIFAGQPESASVYDDVYDSFLEYVRKQTAAAAERRAARLSKYRPNREQKRTAISQSKKK